MARPSRRSRDAVATSAFSMLLGAADAFTSTRVTEPSMLMVYANFVVLSFMLNSVCVWLLIVMPTNVGGIIKYELVGCTRSSTIVSLNDEDSCTTSHLNNDCTKWLTAAW